MRLALLIAFAFLTGFTLVTAIQLDSRLRERALTDVAAAPQLSCAALSGEARSKCFSDAALSYADPELCAASPEPSRCLGMLAAMLMRPALCQDGPAPLDCVQAMIVASSGQVDCGALKAEPLLAARCEDAARKLSASRPRVQRSCQLLPVGERPDCQAARALAELDGKLCPIAPLGVRQRCFLELAKRTAPEEAQGYCANLSGELFTGCIWAIAQLDVRLCQGLPGDVARDCLVQVEHPRLGHCSELTDSDLRYECVIGAAAAEGRMDYCEGLPLAFVEGCRAGAFRSLAGCATLPPLERGVCEARFVKTETPEESPSEASKVLAAEASGGEN